MIRLFQALAVGLVVFPIATIILGTLTGIFKFMLSDLGIETFNGIILVSVIISGIYGIIAVSEDRTKEG